MCKESIQLEIIQKIPYFLKKSENTRNDAKETESDNRMKNDSLQCCPRRIRSKMREFWVKLYVKIIVCGWYGNVK